MHDTCHPHVPPTSLLKPASDLHIQNTKLTLINSVNMMKLAVVLTALLLSSPAVKGYREREGEGEGDERRFVLERAEKVVKTDGGEVRVVRGHRWDGHLTPMHIGFISMEPNTLFVPQYVDANLILFIRKGDVKIGWIHKDDLVEKQLKTGDINRIPAGSTFYIVNTGKGQRLHIICSIDTTNDYYSWDWNAPPYQSFFLGGGIYPKSVLAGFDMTTLTTAFNVTTEEIGAITGSHTAGPIVYITGEAAEEPHRLSSLLNSNLKESTKKQHPTIDDEEDSQPTSSWTFTNLLSSILGFNNNNQQFQTNKKTAGPVRAPDSYNLYDRDPSFKNPFGWSISIDEHDYHPLKHSDIGVYLVNLTAGSMLAPHVNPRATEYGVVLGGAGTIQVVYPNGSSAMKVEVKEGDVFWIPRFFPFCQIASRGGPFKFFGFTTSAKSNHPQFLVGATSVMREMVGPELAAGMGVSEEVLRRLVTAQNESVILPTWPMPWEKEKERERGREEEKGRERERGREEEREREKGREEGRFVMRKVIRA